MYALIFKQKVEKKDNEKIEDFVKNTFIHLYDKDIEEQLSMEDKWKSRKPPITIKHNEIESKLNSLKKGNDKKQKRDVMKVMSLEENALNFIETMTELLNKKKECKELVFDKDDNLSMSFVSSAANLRMHCYGIETKSEFVVKGIAGNIIHAIATTNAIVAGAMVVQAIHILKRNNLLKNKKNQQEKKENETNTSSQQRENELKNEKGKVCWVQNSGQKWLYPQNMEAPRSSCFICQKCIVHLTLNPELFDYGTFEKKILCKNLGFKQPDLVIEFNDPNNDNKTGSNSIESITEDDDDEERKEKELMRTKKLNDPMIKIFNDSSLSIDDFAQDVQVNLKVHYLKLDDEKHPNGFEITNNWTLDKFTLKKEKEEDAEKVNNDKDKNKNENKFIGKKRKTLDDGINGNDNCIKEPPNKKLKISA